MALHDFQPWDNRDITEYVDFAPMKASETFQAGEPIYINSSGVMRICADACAAQAFSGIALGPVRYKTGGTGASTGTTSTKNPRTGSAYTTNDVIPYIQARPGLRLICPRLSAAASQTMDSTLATPVTIANATAQALVGDMAGLQVGTPGGTLEWQVDTSATVTTNDIFRIVGFLDSFKRRIEVSGGAASYVLVQVVQSAWIPASEASGTLNEPVA